MSRWDQIVALGERFDLPVLTIAELRHTCPARSADGEEKA